MTPLVMEKPPEPVEKVREPARIAEDWPDRDGSVSVDLMGRGSSIDVRIRPPETAEEEKSSDESEQPLRLTLAPSTGESEAGRLSASFAALAKLRGSRAPGAWIETAATLKRDAVKLRNSAFSRHADVLLVLADAVTFTDPADASDRSMAVLERGLALLSEPFIGEPAEEAFLIDLMAQGWHLAPAVDPADYPA